MCGIAGFLSNKYQNEEAGRYCIEKMSDQLAHRGPNSRGVFVQPEFGVHLGHTRLSILDLSSPP